MLHFPAAPLQWLHAHRCTAYHWYREWPVCKQGRDWCMQIASTASFRSIQFQSACHIDLPHLNISSYCLNTPASSQSFISSASHDLGQGSDHDDVSEDLPVTKEQTWRNETNGAPLALPHKVLVVPWGPLHRLKRYASKLLRFLLRSCHAAVSKTLTSKPQTTIETLRC